MARLGRAPRRVASPRSARAAWRPPCSPRLGLPGRLTPRSPSLTAGARTARHRCCCAVQSPLLSPSPARPRGSTRPTRPLQTGGARPSVVRLRLESVCTSARLFLRGVTTQHARAEAARSAGRHHAPCSQRWQAHRPVAVSTLERLSTHHAQPVAHARHKGQGLPGNIALLVERTRPHRARRPPDNATRFQPGHGCGLGPPWTKSGCILPDLRIPLRPIPFSSPRDGREHALASHTEPARGSAARRQVDLGDSSGS